MSQKKKVRVYKPGQVDNAMSNWFMQMGGVPQQPQQSQEQDMMNQVMVYAQQMLMEGEDPNIVYDDLVDQGVPSQLAAQVLEQLIQAMPPQQPSYSQPTTAEAMYNQEVEEEEEEEAIPDFMDLAGLYDDEDDDDFEDFKKGGMTKKKFVKEYKKLALGGQKPNQVAEIQSAGFLGSVQNTFKNAKAEQEAEQMFNNPFAVNALSQFVYGGSLPKAQDAGGAGAITKEAFDKYVKEQEERYKQLEQRYNQGYQRNPYGQGYDYGQGYGPGYGPGYNYGNIPTMFNPYGRRSPIFQRTPYLKNFPGAEFAGMQLQDFKIDTKQVDRNKLFKFLGPKTQQTWSATWSKNPVTGKIEPAKPGAATTTPAATTPAASPGTPPAASSPSGTPTTVSSPADSRPNITPTEYMQSQLTLPERPFDASWQNTIQNTAGPRVIPTVDKPSMAFGGYRFQQGGYLPKAQVGPPPEIMPNPFDPSPYQQRYQEQMNAQPYYRDYINKIKAGEDVSDEERDRAEFLFDQTLQPMDQEMMGNYNEFMKTAADPITKKDKIKNALTVDIPALYRDTMYYTKDITNALEDNRKEKDYYANFLAQTTGRNEQFGNRGNYTINQLSNSSNFRPDLDGQIQYSQYGGPVVGEELEMTDEEIKKFLKEGGKLRYV